MQFIALLLSANLCPLGEYQHRSRRRDKLYTPTLPSQSFRYRLSREGKILRVMLIEGKGWNEKHCRFGTGINVNGSA